MSDQMSLASSQNTIVQTFSNKGNEHFSTLMVTEKLKRPNGVSMDTEKPYEQLIMSQWTLKLLGPKN